MAQIVQLPSVPQTSLGRLGDVLFASAADYAGKRRADEREARLRAERLADIESDRGYVRTEGDRQYDRSVADRQGVLKEARDYEKEIYERNRGARLEDVYGDREWQLYVAQLERNLRDNPAGVEEARVVLNKLAADDQQLAARSDALEGLLSRPEPQPNFADVEKEAVARASANIKEPMFGKKPLPTKEQIEAEVPAIAEAHQTRLNAEWQRQRMDAQIQLKLINDRMLRNGAKANTITNIFRIVGIPPAGAAAGDPSLRNLSDPGQASAAPARTDPATAHRNAAAAVLNAVRRPGMTERVQPSVGATNPPTPQEFRTAPQSVLAEPPQAPAPAAPPVQTAPPMRRGFPQEPAYNPGNYAPAGPLSMYDPVMDKAIAGVSNFMRSPHDNLRLTSQGIDDFFSFPDERPALLNALKGIDPNSREAQNIRARLEQIERSMAQKQTRSSQLIEPMSTAVETVPSVSRRAGAGARQLAEPAY